MAALAIFLGKTHLVNAAKCSFSSVNKQVQLIQACALPDKQLHFKDRIFCEATTSGATGILNPVSYEWNSFACVSM